MTSIAVMPREINKQRFYSTAISNLQSNPNRLRVLNPLWLTGFIDDGNPLQGGSSKALAAEQPTSLVIWGTNLTSLVGSGRLTKQESNMIKFPPYQKSIIIGLILSDGWLIFTAKASKNARLGFAQSAANSKYIWYVFSQLSHYCSSFPTVRIRNFRGKKTIGLEFFTRTLSCFTSLYSLFYPNGMKIIPLNIYDLLTPVALAHLIMGDGSAERHGLIICTDSYSVLDVVRLMNVLIIRYRFECTLRYHTPTQPRIYVSERSMPLLRTIVRPHMCPSMLYKIKL